MPLDAQSTLYVNASLDGQPVSRQRDAGIRGRGVMVGSGVLRDIIPATDGVQHPFKREPIYLRGQPSTGVATLLALDWVKHAHPHAWGRCGDPTLLSLDWPARAHPFATNDEQVVSNVSSLLSVKAIFNGKYQVSTVTPGTIVDGDPTTLNVQATTAGVIRLSSVGALTVTADQPTLPTPTVRVPRPCEVPAGIPHITSNLPYDVWQSNSNALFNWRVIYACSRYDGRAKVPVDGYLWKLSKTLYPTAAWDWTYTSFNNVSVNLANAPYGTGRWYFHVAAYTSVGFGPVGVYIVKYNHRPVVPGSFFMKINGLDTLADTPHVAHEPTTPHVLTWSAFSDSDSADVLTYEVEIGNRFDFSVNPANGRSSVEATFTNLPAATKTLTQTLDPGLKFWRIRAHDGSEYSEWGPVGHFRVNYPPEKPSDLEVRSLLP